MLDSYLAYSSTLKVEAISSSETSVNSHPTIRRYIPEDRTGHSDQYEWVRKSMIDLKVAGLQVENRTKGAPTIKNSQQSKGNTHSIGYTYIGLLQPAGLQRAAIYRTKF
jgi:hypothetical protein